MAVRFPRPMVQATEYKWFARHTNGGSLFTMAPRVTFLRRDSLKVTLIGRSRVLVAT